MGETVYFYLQRGYRCILLAEGCDKPSMQVIGSHPFSTGMDIGEKRVRCWVYMEIVTFCHTIVSTMSGTRMVVLDRSIGDRVFGSPFCLTTTSSVCRVGSRFKHHKPTMDGDFCLTLAKPR